MNICEHCYATPGDRHTGDCPNYVSHLPPLEPLLECGCPPGFRCLCCSYLSGKTVCTICNPKHVKEAGHTDRDEIRARLLQHGTGSVHWIIQAMNAGIPVTEEQRRAVDDDQKRRRY